MLVTPVNKSASLIEKFSAEGESVRLRQELLEREREAFEVSHPSHCAYRRLRDFIASLMMRRKSPAQKQPVPSLKSTRSWGLDVPAGVSSKRA